MGKEGERGEQRGGEERQEEEKGEEGKGDRKKVGRPRNVERLTRERANSMPLLEVFKRGEKRKERQEEEREVEGVEAFKKSSKVERSPVKGVGGGWEDIIREMREGFKELMREMKELREGREEMKVWMEESRKGWEKENGELKKRIESLEKRLKEHEERERGKEGEERRKEEKEGGNLKGRIREEVGELEGRMRRLELEGEKKKREERKRNIIIRGVEVKKEGQEGLKEEVEGIVKATGAVAKIEGIRRIGGRGKERGEMVWVRFASVQEKLEVIKGKAKLKDRSEWITDDLTERERRVDWLLKREAEKRRREGKKVKVGYMKLWVEGKMWIWDEMEDELRESKGQEGLKVKRVENEVGVGKRKEVFC